MSKIIRFTALDGTPIYLDRSAVRVIATDDAPKKPATFGLTPTQREPAAPTLTEIRLDHFSVFVADPLDEVVNRIWPDWERER